MAQRQKPIVGLDIDPAGVTVARVIAGDRLTLQDAVVARLEPGVVRDGEVVDAEALAETLRTLWAANKGLDRRVRVGVANQKVVVRTIELPAGADGKELDAAVRFQAQDALPMPIDQAVIDWQALDVVQTDGGPRLKVLIAAARRDMIEPVLGAVRAAGLRVDGIDLGAFAMIRSLKDEADAGETVLFAEIAGITNVAVATGPQCLFARASGTGVEGIAVELAERKGLTLEHARAWLEHVGLTAPLETIDGDAEIVGEARHVLEDGARRVAAELRQSLDFHHMQGDGAQVTRAIVTGPALRIPGLYEAVGAEIGLPVAAGTVAGEVQGIHNGDVTVAAGLAAPGTPGVNLLPAEERRAAGTGGRSGGAVYAALGVLALLLVMVTSYALASGSVSAKSDEVAALTTQADQAEQAAKSLAAYTDFSALREQRIQTVASLAASRFDWAHALGEISRTLPRRVWLSTISGSVTPGPDGGGGGVTSALPGPSIQIAGCTTSHARVATVMSALRRADGVVRVSLASSQKSTAAGGGSGDGDCAGGSKARPRFKLTLFFAAPPAPAAPTATAPAPTTAADTAPPGGSK